MPAILEPPNPGARHYRWPRRPTDAKLAVGADNKEKTMLVHSVYFWLKPELTAGQRQAIRDGLEKLRGIRQVRQMFVGAPAATAERGVGDLEKLFSSGDTWDVE